MAGSGHIDQSMTTHSAEEADLATTSQVHARTRLEINQSQHHSRLS
jgi:hypothetical protein